MYEWAENNIKLHHSKETLKKEGTPVNEVNLKRAYIRAGGRIVLEYAEYDDKGNITRPIRYIDNKSSEEEIEAAIGENTAVEKSGHVEHRHDLETGTVLQKKVTRRK